MPTETRPRTTTIKPITPALSSNFRAKTVFTPRLATNSPASPASTSQRNRRQQTLSPERKEEDRPRSLNSNITPRSGARVSRAGTDSPYTPDVARHVPEVSITTQSNAPAAHGLDISSPTHAPTYSAGSKPPERPYSSSNVRRFSGGSIGLQTNQHGGFVRANEAKSVSTQSRPLASRSKTTSFVQTNSPRLSPKKSVVDTKDGMESKFFYANNVAVQQTKPARPTLITKLSGTPSAQPSSVLGNRRSPTSNARSPKSTVSTSMARNPVQNTSSIKPRSPVTKTFQMNTSDRRRSSSLNVKSVSSCSPQEHRKSLSASTVSINLEQTSTPCQPKLAQKQEISTPDSPSIIRQYPATSMSSSTTSPRSTSLASTNTVATSAASDPPHAHAQPQISSALSTRHSRNSSESTAIQPISQSQLEAAASARRERKVLDLEISNSSLLAINKTLEKELRKQNTELRRFRRLSRSGRLSFNPSNRIVSGASMSTLATLDEVDPDQGRSTLSLGSSEDNSLDEDDIDDYSDEGSSFTESSDSMRRRTRDERRLLQDLQRHQQILIDSQKLTQSIQRCLNCTDELIRDANKALSYQVEPEEVRIGGRVLIHDDEELSEVDFSRVNQSTNKTQQSLLGTAVLKTTLEEASMWLSGLPSMNESSDPKPHDQTIIQPQPALTQSPSPSPTLKSIISPQKDPLIPTELD